MKTVLDTCCGSRMFWFDRNDPRVTFHALMVCHVFNPVVVRAGAGWRGEIAQAATNAAATPATRIGHRGGCTGRGGRGEGCAEAAVLV